MSPVSGVMKSRIIPNRASVSATVSAAVGSSITRIRESYDNARAISTICWRATDRSPIRAFGSILMPKRSKRSDACLFSAASSIHPNRWLP